MLYDYKIEKLHDKWDSRVAEMNIKVTKNKQHIKSRQSFRQ